MARSDHWRCVSMPKWARPSSNVTSRLQRFMRVANDLFCCLSGVSGKDGFGGTLALRITGQYPSDRQRIRAIAVPQGCAGAHLHSSFSFAIPVQGVLLPEGLRIL